MMSKSLDKDLAKADSGDHQMLEPEKENLEDALEIVRLQEFARTMVLKKISTG
jgi:hypothetical protein